MKWKYYKFDNGRVRNSIIRTDDESYQYFSHDEGKWIYSEKARFFVQDKLRVKRITKEEAFLGVI